jgi:hypothetical protein
MLKDMKDEGLFPQLTGERQQYRHLKYDYCSEEMSRKINILISLQLINSIIFIVNCVKNSVDDLKKIEQKIQLSFPFSFDVEADPGNT